MYPIKLKVSLFRIPYPFNHTDCNCLCRKSLTKWDILSAILALLGITLTSVPPIRYVLQSYNKHSDENKAANLSLHGQDNENMTLESTHDKEVSILLAVSMHRTV